jgi:bifunctional DNA-binding transcriptional regulator/antitoxin component of YhaV-PrlF toxin-antitoxin module
MPIEQIRNIIRFGESGYVVTLPRAWLRYYKLNEKDKVRLIADGKIIIEPIIRKKPKQEKETEA